MEKKSLKTDQMESGALTAMMWLPETFKAAPASICIPACTNMSLHLRKEGVYVYMMEVDIPTLTPKYLRSEQ